MAKKSELTIVLRAKNAMVAGINSAYKSLQSFGSSIAKIGKFFATAFLSAGGAIAGFVAKAVSAYSVQEKAERALASSIKAYGENANEALPKLKKIAAAIQDETGAADEATIAGMARLKMMGVQTNQLEAASKAVVALKSNNIEGATAEKLVANAIAGNYSALARYIPELKNATSEAEKAALVNQFLSAGYQTQKDQLNTVSGAWGALKGRIGDAWEEVGAAISQNGALVAALTKAGDAVKQLGQRIADLSAGGGMSEAMHGVKVFVEESVYRFKLMGHGFAVAWAGIKDAASGTISYISGVVSTWKTAMAEQFKYIGAVAAAAWKKIKSPSSEFVMPSSDALSKASAEYVAALKNKDAFTAENTKAALKELESLNAEHYMAMKELSAERLQQLKDEAEQKVETEEAALEQIVVANEDAAQSISDAWRDADAIRADIAAAESEVEAAKQAREKADEEAKSAPQRFLDREFRRQEREKEKQAAREKRQLEIALESGRRGRTGANIDRARAVEAAKVAAAIAEEKEFQAKEELRARQAELEDAMKRTADSSEKIEENTRGLPTLLTPAP